MKATRKITIKDKEREAIFTLRLLSYASEHGIEIKMPTARELEQDKLAWVGPYVDIIYTGLLVGCDRAGVVPDFDRWDVEIWATEKPNEFSEVVSGLIGVITTGEKSDPEAEEERKVEDDSDEKKNYSRTTTKSRVSWWARAVTRVRRFWT